MYTNFAHITASSTVIDNIVTRSRAEYLKCRLIVFWCFF